MRMDIVVQRHPVEIGACRGIRHDIHTSVFRGAEPGADADAEPDATGIHDADAMEIFFYVDEYSVDHDAMAMAMTMLQKYGMN